MPLVVPGLSTSPLQDEWTNKLVGKKITDSGGSDATCFARRDLPEQHRIIEPGKAYTADFVERRLNIHTAEDGTVMKVAYG